MSTRTRLGRMYGDGQAVCSQGETGNCLFVIQQGQVEIVAEDSGTEVVVGVAGKDELLGEMAVFLRGARSATVRARGPARVLTVDKHTLLLRINEDPTLAFRIIETMGRRIRELNRQVLELTRVARAQSAAPH